MYKLVYSWEFLKAFFLLDADVFICIKYRKEQTMNGIKKICLRVYEDGTVLASDDVLGFIGEHMSTRLAFELPPKLKSNSYTYTLNFQNDSGNVWVGNLLDDYTFTVPMELTGNNHLYVQLTISEADRVVFKGNCVKFGLHKGVSITEVANKYNGLLDDTLNRFDTILSQLEDKDLSKLKGVISIEKTAVNGLEDTYTVTYTDKTTSTFMIKNGSKGDAYILTESDKLEIAEIVSKEYPVKAHRAVTPFTAIKDSNTTITSTSYEEGEI